MGEDIVQTDEDFLSLHEVGSVEILINASAGKPSARHKLTPSADRTVVEAEVLILRVEFSDMALNDGHSPAVGELVVIEHL